MSFHEHPSMPFEVLGAVAQARVIALQLGQNCGSSLFRSFEVTRDVVHINQDAVHHPRNL
jgi:hypothetical protein